MNKINKTIMILISLLIMASLTVLAALPNGVVVIGDKAYDITYVNDTNNYQEIHKLIVHPNNKVYVKGFNGKWYDNATNKIISKDKIPAVTYKGIDGTMKKYAAQDGKEVKAGHAKSHAKKSHSPYISLTVRDCTVNEGQSVTPIINKTKGASLSYKSNNTEVATVNSSTREIIGISPGIATISVTASKSGYKSLTKTLTIRVNKVNTDIDCMIDRVAEVSNKTNLVIYNDENKVVDSYKNYIGYSQGDNHIININIKKDATIESVLNKKWELEAEPAQGLFDGIKNDFKAIEINNNDEKQDIREYINEKLQGYENIKLPDGEISLSDITSFLKNIFNSDDTVSIIKAMAPQGKDIAATIYGEELQSINVKLENGNKAEIYNNKTNKTITTDEITNLFNTKTFKDRTLTELKGTYEVKIGNITYTVDITD